MGVRHVRVEHLGTIAGGAERWSCGHQAFAAVGPNDVDGMAVLGTTTFLADIFGATGINNKISPSVVYQGCRVRVVNAAGITEQVAENLLTTPAAGSAGGGGASMPPECAVVVSLLTAVAGARGRGRAYFPAMAAGILTPTGSLDPTVQDALAQGWQAYVNDWNDDTTALRVGVASNVGGFVTAVDRVRVGNIIDSQRGRRHSLPEAYITYGITP